MIRLALLALLAVAGTAAPSVAQADAAAQSAADSTGADLPPPPLSEMSCREFEAVYFREIPLAVFAGDPDWLYELVIHAAEECDLGEPLGRMQILASIWDGNFQEIIYGYNVVGWLADRYDLKRLPAAGSEHAAFDDFTQDFANQLLPHVPVGSVEEFFCLFYAGEPAGALELLRGDELADTWLRYYYDEEIGLLTRVEKPYVFGLYWGGWQPHGDQAIAGTRQLLGGSVEQANDWGFLRLAVEGRLGRADQPYFVQQGKVVAYSDRWDAALLAVEAGVVVWRTPAHKATVFAGIGYDGIRPFKDEDISLSSLNVSLGLGYRWRAGPAKRWGLSADARLEWTGDRNGGGTPLGGTAQSVRLGIVAALGRDPAPRLGALGHTER